MKRKYDGPSNYDKNVNRAMNLLKTRKIAIRGMKNAGKRVSVPMSFRKNIRVSGLIGRFQPGGGSEYKFKDTFTDGGVRALVKTGDSIFYNSTPIAISIVTGIQRNTGPNDRIGNNITVKSINFKATVVLGATAPATSFSGSYKVFIILDKQANGTTPSVTDIWAPGTSSGTNASINSNLSITNSLRFSILKMFSGSLQVTPYYDSTIPQLGRGSASDLINFSMKCNIPVKYSNDNSTGVSTGITDNNIWIYAFSDDIGDTQLQLINAYSRVRYSDN